MGYAYGYGFGHTWKLKKKQAPASPAAVGGGILLAGETEGFATDFLYATDSKRVAKKVSNVITNYALDSFYANASTSPKMVYDVAGTLVWSPHNLCLYSQDIDNANWTKQANVTVTPNAVLAPDGTMTADQIDWGSAANLTGIISPTDSGVITGAVYTFGLWVRSDSGTGDIQVTDGAQTAAIAIVTIDTTWKFVSLTEVKINAIGNWAMWVRRTASSPARIYVWGAQCNRGSVRTAYLPTTTAHRVGLALDYDPVTHAARGLLVEPAATNMCPQSAAGRAGFLWTANGSTLTGGQADPAGGLEALRVVTTANGGLNVYQQILSLPAGTTYVSSMWCKGTAGQQIFFITGDSTHASDQLIVTFTGAWQRVSLSFVSTSSAYVGFELYNRQGGAHLPNVTFTIWGGQFELGTVATSHIPTLAATVTRAQDVYNFTAASINHSATAGSWWTEHYLLDSPTARVIDYNTAIPLFYNNSGYELLDGTVFYILTNTVNAVNKAIAAFQSGDRAITGNGLVPVTDTGQTTGLLSPTTVYFNARPGFPSEAMNGWIRKVRYLPRRPSNIEMQTMTIADPGVGADALLVGETGGLAADFTFPTAECRVAVRTAGVPTYSSTSFFTQAGTSPKWVYNAAGVLVSASTGTLAFDYDPVTHVPLGLLVEPQATNVLSQSAGGRAGFLWSGNGSTFVGGQPDPSGGTEALQVTTTANLGINVGQQATTGITAGQVYIGSCWCKGTAGQQMYFNPSSDISSVQITVTFTGRWQRVSKSFTAVGTAAYLTWERYDRIGGAHLPNVTFTVWGGQMEAGDVATSYIPTLAATVTRAADNITCVLPASATGAEFSNYIRWSASGVPTARFPFVMTDTSGGFTDVVGWADNGAPRFNVVDNGVMQAQLWPGPNTTLGVSSSMAARVKANDFYGNIDGYVAPAGPDTSGTVPTVTRGMFGTNGVWGGVTLTSYRIQKFSVVSRAWNDAEINTRSAAT